MDKLIINIFLKEFFFLTHWLTFIKIKLQSKKSSSAAGEKIDSQSYLFGKLLFTEFVKNIKLLSQDNIFKKTTACKFNSHNDLKIKIVRFFSTTLVKNK